MAETPADIINLAFVTIGTIQAAETITTAIQNDAYLRLQTMWRAAGTEQGITNAWYHQSFNLTAGVNIYTLGTGGSLVATATPVRVVGFQSVSGNFRSSGKVLSFQEFDEQVEDPVGSSSVLAKAVAADNSYPNINIKVFPVPASGPGNLILDYCGVMADLPAVGSNLSLAPEFEYYLYTNLAVLLYPTYARAGYDPSLIIKQAADAKQAILQKNISILQPQAAAPSAA